MNHAGEERQDRQNDVDEEVQCQPDFQERRNGRQKDGQNDV